MDDPRRPPKIVTLTKASVARTQLETAISLWFNYGDPMSIHTLAAAAHKVYHRIGSKAGAPTLIETWKKSLSKKDYDRAVKAENFAKHASRDPDEQLPLLIEHGELLILDSIDCHHAIFQKRTPLMTCFLARFGFENARFIDATVPPGRRGHFHRAVREEELAGLSRIDYLDIVLRKLQRP